MNSILNKKDFYKMILRDRLPIVQSVFPLNCGEDGGKIEIYSTPLGLVLLARFKKDVHLREIKLYDKRRGRFTIQNLFCGDNLIKLSEGEFISASAKVQVEDIVGNDFLIKVDDLSIFTRAEAILPRVKTVDKTQHLVYN